MIPRPMKTWVIFSHMWAAPRRRRNNMTPPGRTILSIAVLTHMTGKRPWNRPCLQEINDPLFIPMVKRFVRKEIGARDVSTLANPTHAIIRDPSFWLRNDWFLGVVLVVAVILTYLPVWKAGFVWDDDLFITTNPCIIGPLGLKDIWTTSA